MNCRTIELSDHRYEPLRTGSGSSTVIRSATGESVRVLTVGVALSLISLQYFWIFIINRSTLASLDSIVKLHEGCGMLLQTYIFRLNKTSYYNKHIFSYLKKPIKLNRKLIKYGLSKIVATCNMVCLNIKVRGDPDENTSSVPLAC